MVMDKANEDALHSLLLFNTVLGALVHTNKEVRRITR